MALPSFHNVRFPEDISYGSSGGPGFNTTIIELSSGAEQRNVNWSLARGVYDVSHGIKTRDQMEQVLDFFTARRGKAYGFRFKDWMDYQLDRQVIGVTDVAGNTVLQLFKRYEPLTSYFYDRPLTKIVEDSVRVWANGVETPGAPLVNLDTGVLAVPSIHTPGTQWEVECEFDVPCRFDTDEVKITHDDFELMSWPNIPIVELKNY